MQKITPYLWFDTQAEEAAQLYCSIFKRSKILNVDRVPGRVLSVEFDLDGQRLVAFNGGPHFTLNEAFSLSVSCESQAEIDEVWAKLIADGGAPSRCGWLKDRFGLSWQIVPVTLRRMLTDPDAARSKRVMTAMFAMDKLDLASLQQAFDGE